MVCMLKLLVHLDIKFILRLKFLSVKMTNWDFDFYHQNSKNTFGNSITENSIFGGHFWILKNLSKCYFLIKRLKEKLEKVDPPLFFGVCFLHFFHKSFVSASKMKAK